MKLEKFIDEQGVDMIKRIRSGYDNTLESKLEAIEWIARYAELLEPTIIEGAVREFVNEFQPSSSISQNVPLHTISGQHAEGVTTAVSNLKNFKRRLDQGQMESVELYDSYNYHQLTILELLLGNPQEAKTLVSTQGIAELGRLMAEQPLPREVQGDFNYNSDFVNQSFKPALRCLAMAMRHENCVLTFMANTAWYERFLSIAEEF